MTLTIIECKPHRVADDGVGTYTCRLVDESGNEHGAVIESFSPVKPDHESIMAMANLSLSSLQRQLGK